MTVYIAEDQKELVAQANARLMDVGIQEGALPLDPSELLSPNYFGNYRHTRTDGKLIEGINFRPNDIVVLDLDYGTHEDVGDKYNGIDVLKRWMRWKSSGTVEELSRLDNILIYSSREDLVWQQIDKDERRPTPAVARTSGFSIHFQPKNISASGATVDYASSLAEAVVRIYGGAPSINRG